MLTLLMLIMTRLEAWLRCFRLSLVFLTAAAAAAFESTFPNSFYLLHTCACNDLDDDALKAKMINGCLSVAAVQERRLDKAGLDPHRQAELQRDTVLLPEEGVPHAQICSEIIARCKFKKIMMARRMKA